MRSADFIFQIYFCKRKNKYKMLLKNRCSNLYKNLTRRLYIVLQNVIINMKYTNNI